MPRPVVAIALVLLLTGCATDHESAAVIQDPALALASTTEPLKESLFKDDQKVISNEDMEKILAAKVILPAHAKLAVIRFGQLPYWWGWSEEFVRMNEKIDADFLGKLAGTSRIEQVSY